MRSGWWPGTLPACWGSTRREHGGFLSVRRGASSPLPAAAGALYPAGAARQAHRHPAADLAHAVGALRGSRWLAAVLCALCLLPGHRADALGRLRHQRLRRPRLRRLRGAHRQPAAGPAPDRSMGGRGRFRGAQPAGAAPGISLRAAGVGAGRRGCHPGRQLSVLQALLCHSAGVSGHCLWLWHTDGLCGTHRVRAAVGLDHAGGQHPLDHRLRHRIRHGRPR